VQAKNIFVHTLRVFKPFEKDNEPVIHLHTLSVSPSKHAPFLLLKQIS